MRLKLRILLLICLVAIKIHAQWNPISGGYNYSGNIGIGSTMTSLSGALHVNGINASGWSYFSGNVNGAGNPLNIPGLAFGWNKSGGAGESLIVYNTSLGVYPKLSFNSFNGTTFSEEMTLVGGKLGIGINNPQEKLHVANGAVMASDPTFNSINVKIDGTSVPIIKFTRWTGGGSEQHNAFVGQFYNPAAGSEYSLGFGTGRSYTGVQNEYTNRMCILTNGAVGIGTTTPPEKLTVQGNIQVPLLSSIGYLQSTDKFVHNGNTLGNYSLGWINDLSNSGAPTAIFSGFGGIKLITGSQSRLIIDQSGKIGINTTTPDAQLSVKGQIHAQEVKVDLNGAVAPDYVFEPTYKLSPLDSIKTYIDKNKHLPEVPSAKEMEKNGVKLGEMNMLLLKKIEELTLYVIELKKVTEKQTTEIENLKSKR